MTYQFDHSWKRERERLARIEEVSDPWTPLTADEGVIVPYRLLALTLIEQLETMLEGLDRFDEKIAGLMPQHPDHELFEVLPGAGPVYTIQNQSCVAEWEYLARAWRWYPRGGRPSSDLWG